MLYLLSRASSTPHTRAATPLRARETLQRIKAGNSWTLLGRDFATVQDGLLKRLLPDDVVTQRPKNEVGVQLLSPSLHSQIFQNASFPPPEPSFVQIARDHLAQHGLDTSQASVLDPVAFELPPLQGETIDHHFHRIGSSVAEPHLSIAKKFAARALPSPPEFWNLQSGWTKYYPDGSYEAVEHPKEEEMLCFDVETLPNYHPYAVMACAASPDGWYGWISPWLLEETEDPAQLIPFGDPSAPRVVIGHNVAYDRARVKEEYSLERTGNRWIDTMALHVAVKGISSHQRPSWMTRLKEKRRVKELRKETVEVVQDMAHVLNGDDNAGVDGVSKDVAPMKTESLDELKDVDGEDEDAAETRWEDITAMNSLAEVARLHCGIHMDKTTRDDFMTSTPQEIRERLRDYLTYCATDVHTTHAVYQKVLPIFLEACPSPVSAAGAFFMGNGFLPVDQSWQEYIRNAEDTYTNLSNQVQTKLHEFAHEAKVLMDTPEKWRSDEWLSQLDWSPKAPGRSRGVAPMRKKKKEPPKDSPWYRDFVKNPFSPKALDVIIPLLLRLSWNGGPVLWSADHGWMYGAVSRSSSIPLLHQADGAPSESSGNDNALRTLSSTRKVRRIIGKTIGLGSIQNGRLTCPERLDILERLCEGARTDDIRDDLLSIAGTVYNNDRDPQDPWLSQLNWGKEEAPSDALHKDALDEPHLVVSKDGKEIIWPKWYWELTAPKKDKAPGTLDLTVRSRVAPLLLRLRWLGWPLFHFREHGWTFRVPANEKNFKTKLKPLVITEDSDAQAHPDGPAAYKYYKLPHKDGDAANVGSPLAKVFMKHFDSGTLTSPAPEAKLALEMNAQCSYWISARDRVMKQMVVWDGDGGSRMGFGGTSGSTGKWGMILPQVVTMGTVTRRAIENTWLTASNAKKNRVGSELKAMVRAPPGYAIVGADVDSEELWISSLMGDAQFGVHGATALGWMTLEGQKKHGTDLHSKTATILGIDRDGAKVFNYSRIYGAGTKHASLLLLQNTPNMSKDEAKKLAKNLYASTKGKNTQRDDYFGRSFWYGGSESYVFNKLEEIALSNKPETPALGCTITHALRKEFLKEGFGNDYMTSRINWVVQSSGVDYLHLLIVAMEHLISRCDIQARYLISVHDELRYLVKEEDKYRCALALQIANLWTRCLFAYRLGMDNLPQGVAFFSAVDVDHVLRKEVDLPCVTPSQPHPIPPGEKLDILEVLAKTDGSLSKDGSPSNHPEIDYTPFDASYTPPNCLTHRAKGAAFLQAQCTTDDNEIRMLAEYDAKRTFPEKAPRSSRSNRKKETPKQKPDREWLDIAAAEDEALREQQHEAMNLTYWDEEEVQQSRRLVSA